MSALTAFEQHLIRSEVVDDAKLARAKAESESKEMTLQEVIPQMGLASEEAVFQSLADFCELRYLRPVADDIAPEVVEKVPARYATHYNIVPIEERRGSIVIAVSDPMNTNALDDIRTVLKMRTVPVVATPTDIRQTIKKIYGVGADTMEKIPQSGGSRRRSLAT